MDCITPITDIVFRVMPCTKKHINYLRKLGENLDQLKEKNAQLIARKSDINTRVDADETRSMKRTDEVDEWMKRVENRQPEVDRIILEGEQHLQRRCLNGCCPKNFWSSYKVGKKVVKKLTLVDELMGQGNFQTVSVNRPRPGGVMQPVDTTSVGMESMFDRVRGILGENSVRIMGLYGMGGVGKTTLLTKINNELTKTSSDFDIVIWVVISQTVNMAGVQKDIAKRLGCDENEIFNVLQTKKFLLLLDDIWDRIELNSIGVPPPSSENRSKIVFTTRSKDVCGLMEADKDFEVKCLMWEESWTLFQQKVGPLALKSHPEISELAEIVAKECQGLPLALITIGRAMARKMTRQEWKHAISVLQNSYAYEIPGMGDTMYPKLKFSYDSLPDDACRLCFLFCSLYPEDYKINIVKLIEQWIGEGYISGDNFEEAFNKGHSIIGTLKNACLLEDENNGDPKCLYDVNWGKAVKMHDVLRDLALWIARDCGSEKDKYFVKAGLTLTEAPEAGKWPTRAEKISLMKNEIAKLENIPKCPNLKTLLLSSNRIISYRDRDRDVGHICDGFFLSMPDLRFLDLSNTPIKKLPTSLWQLHELEYLDLSNTSIQTLPSEIGNLKKLKYLSLPGTMLEIPRGIVMNLLNLEILKLCQDTKGDIDELGCLTKLKFLEIRISSGMKDVEKFLSCPLVANCTIILRIEECHESASFALSTSSSSSSSDLCLGNLKSLSDLQIMSCPEIKELKLNCKTAGLYSNLENMGLDTLPKLIISWDVKDLISSNVRFRNLRFVSLDRCHAIVDLTWLLLIPNIEKLKVSYCDNVQEIISSSDESGGAYPYDEETFSKLQSLDLNRLPNFQSICSMSALSFSSLEYIKVVGCPKLRKLPLDTNSAKNTLKMIKGEAEWWNGLEWENEIIKTQFESLVDHSQRIFFFKN